MKRRDGPEDPFADDEPDEDGVSEESYPTESDASATRGVTDEDEGDSSDSLPWIYRRNSVKGDRPHLIQANVREETVDRQDDALDAVENMLGEDVYATDLREAALLVAFDRPELIADQLREWGYDYK
jgi:hypothetical protein